MKNKSSIIIYYYLLNKIYTKVIVFLFIIFISLQPANSQKTSNEKIKKPIWGSSCAPFPGEKGITGAEAWNRLNEKIKSVNGGKGLEARRSYDRGIPGSFAASAMAPDLNMCPVSVGSFKPSWKETIDGTNHDAMRKFIQSVPDDHEVYLVFHHEPENEALSGRSAYSPVMLQQAFGKFVEVVVESGKKNVHPCFVLMSWTFNPKSGRNPEDFNMAKFVKKEYIGYVIAGMDGYSATPETVAPVDLFDKNLNVLKSWGFSRFGIFETATHSSDSGKMRSEWIGDLGKWAASRKDMELICWFNSAVGDKAGPTGWYLGKYSPKEDGTFNWTDGDNSLKAYGKLVSVKY